MPEHTRGGAPVRVDGEAAPSVPADKAPWRRVAGAGRAPAGIRLETEETVGGAGLNSDDRARRKGAVAAGAQRPAKPIRDAFRRAAGKVARAEKTALLLESAATHLAPVPIHFRHNTLLAVGWAGRRWALLCALAQQAPAGVGLVRQALDVAVEARTCAT